MAQGLKIPNIALKPLLGIISPNRGLLPMGGKKKVVPELWFLLVGGGAGGYRNNAGGKGGQVFENRMKPPDIGTYSVVVGNGGAGGYDDGAGYNGEGTNGENSSAFGFTALGAVYAETPNGLNGPTSNISGTNVVYGSDAAGNSGGAGGLGSGFGATGTNVDGISGIANRGGGGGRSGGADGSQTVFAGIGGSGVVIIAYPIGFIVATGGTITDFGGYRIHTFNSSANWIRIS